MGYVVGSVVKKHSSIVKKQGLATTVLTSIVCCSQIVASFPFVNTSHKKGCNYQTFVVIVIGNITKIVGGVRNDQ
jgi:hypothetical protein